MQALGRYCVFYRTLFYEQTCGAGLDCWGRCIEKHKSTDFTVGLMGNGFR